MGFWNKVGKLVGTVVENGPAIMEALQREGAKKQAELQRKQSTMYKKAERQIKDHERKVEQAAKSARMSDPDFARKVKEEMGKIEKVKVKLHTGNTSSNGVKTNTSGEVTFKDLTVSQWNSRWIKLGRMSDLTLDDLRPYNKYIGLYKAEMNGKVAYLGRALEYNNGGFRKRLRDYVRDSDSARTHGSGKKMNEYADQLWISILIVGDSKEDVKIVEALEVAMIAKLNVNWNVQHNRSRRN